MYWSSDISNCNHSHPEPKPCVAAIYSRQSIVTLIVSQIIFIHLRFLNGSLVSVCQCVSLVVCNLPRRPSSFILGGGNIRIESVRLDFKDKAQAKVGSLDNAGQPIGRGPFLVRASPTQNNRQPPTRPTAFNPKVFPTRRTIYNFFFIQ